MQTQNNCLYEYICIEWCYLINKNYTIIQTFPMLFLYRLVIHFIHICSENYCYLVNKIYQENKNKLSYYIKFRSLVYVSAAFIYFIFCVEEKKTCLYKMLSIFVWILPSFPYSHLPPLEMLILFFFFTVSFYYTIFWQDLNLYENA